MTITIKTRVEMTTAIITLNVKELTVPDIPSPNRADRRGILVSAPPKPTATVEG
jgi:hypothetical protein